MAGGSTHSVYMHTCIGLEKLGVGEQRVENSVSFKTERLIIFHNLRNNQLHDFTKSTSSPFPRTEH